MPEALAQVVGGDPLALPLVASLSQADLLLAATLLHSPLVVTRRAAASVLKGYAGATYSPQQVQAWASFVRRGYVASPSKEPIRPLDIEYEEAWEDAIVEVVSRLDEIGDLIEGEVTVGDALDLLELLGP